MKDLLYDFLAVFAEGIVTVGVWLIHSAAERHNAMMKVMRYLPQRITWWTVLGVSCVWWTVVEVLDFGIPLMAITMVLIFPVLRRFHGPSPSLITLSLWEFILYTHVFGIVIVLGAALFVGLNVEKLLRDGGALIGWVLNIYLYIEIFAPPRQRKKVKVPSLSKPAVAEFVT